MNNQLDQIAKAIEKADKIVLFHHIRPDGDSISCSYGMLKNLQNKFPKKTIKWVADQEYIEDNLKFLNIDFSKDLASSEEIDSSWMGIIGDNAVLERTYGFEIFSKTGFKICFDHHQNEIDFTTDIFYHESSLGASAIQAYLILEKLNVNFTSQNAILSLIGILTDTGFFRFSLADHRPLEAASKLTKFIENKDLDAFYQKFNQKTVASIAIEGFLLQNYKIKSKIAYAFFDLDSQKKLKVKPDQCARPNTIGNIEGTKAWILFTEYEDHSIRVEFRSLGLPVNEVAKKFNGGGHIRASGARVTREEIDQVVNETIKALNEFEKQTN